MRHGLLPALRLKVIEDSGDDVGIVDAGNDPNRTPAMLADFDIDSEHPLETPCPSHGAVFFGSGHWLVGSASLAAPGRCDLGAPAAVGGEDSMEASEVDPGSWHLGNCSCVALTPASMQSSAASRAMTCTA